MVSCSTWYAQSAWSGIVIFINTKIKVFREFAHFINGHFIFYLFIYDDYYIWWSWLKQNEWNKVKKFSRAAALMWIQFGFGFNVSSSFGDGLASNFYKELALKILDVATYEKKFRFWKVYSIVVRLLSYFIRNLTTQSVNYRLNLLKKMR